MRVGLIVIAPLVLGACSSIEPAGGAPMVLINASGQPVGSVRAWETAGGLSFRINATGLPHGLHGVHIHSVGRCETPDFASAGPHWNPAGKKHGLNNPAGPHAGDFPNVEVAADGVLEATVTLPHATIANLLDNDGSALVIHANADDNASDPAGNSGARIACAIIRPGAEVR